MPSTIIHLTYSLLYGFGLYALSESKFNVTHVCILCLGATNGPDAGPMLEFLLTSIPWIGGFIMDVVHRPFGFPLTLGVVYAVLTSWASQFSLVRNDGGFKLEKGARRVRRWQSWIILLAGCLLHFQLDVPFEENGGDSMYKWILSTGYWERKDGENPNQVTPLLAFVFVVVIFGIILGLIKIWSAESLERQVDWQRFYASIKLISCTLIAYLFFIATRTFRSPKIPAVGEEADLGVGIFVLVFQLAPLYLCWTSYAFDILDKLPVHVQDWV
jgi:hypothetical protein